MHRPVPLTPFVDFALTAGPSRVKLARSLRDDPPSDFYDPAKQAIVEALRDEVSAEDFASRIGGWLASRSSDRERRIFAKVIDGFGKFLGAQRGRMVWFEPPLRDFPAGPGPLLVRVDPEIGLLLDGRPHVVKVHWRGDPLDVPRLALTNTILARALQATWPGTVMAVLDVRRGRLFVHRPSGEARQLLHGEATALGAYLDASDEAGKSA